ncbi:Tetratricopeptide repeat protein 9A, partial [Podila humilis]
MSTVEEKIKAALVHKDSGNEAFKLGDLQKALTQYHLAVLGLSGLVNKMGGMGMLPGLAAAGNAGGSNNNAPGGGSATDDQTNLIKTNLGVVYSNMAACHLKKQNYKRAIEVCNDALKHDPENIKAKFRRAQAKLQDGNLAGAEADLT